MFFIEYPYRVKGYKFFCPSRGNKIVESMHAKFLELDVVEPVIASDNIDFVMSDVITLPLPNFDNVRSSNDHGDSSSNENVAKPPVENVVEPLVEKCS